MRFIRDIHGAKDSGGSSGGTESPDSLHSTSTAKILDIIGEGPMVGLKDGLRSVYLDGTPILNADGSSNFQNYTVDTRLGTVDQAYMSGFPSVENEIAIGVALTDEAPWVRQVTNTALSAVRVRFGLPEFLQTNTSTGDITGYRAEYAIDLATDGGSYSTVVTGAFDGKTTTLYERSIRIELPTSTGGGWLVRVRRLTANQHNVDIQDTINIEAITEVVDRKLRYPNTALIGLTFDAKSFSSVPTRGYLVRGRIIDVPSNYDPETRTYSGVWDGTFKLSWTNNPAWVFNDIAKNTRFGGGRFVDASAIDKWRLYEIGVYCDELVSDGQGGQEPRFTCNAVLQSQADAFKVLQDFATIFRGQTYWGAGAIVTTADVPRDPTAIYAQANVIDGKFTYTSTERKTRYTAAQVSYNDTTNQYQQAVEYAQDDDGLARYGLIKAAVTAFGCTSQSEAHRRALWILASSQLETQTVTFSVGLDGTLCGPGDVVAIADARKAGRRNGGRVRGMADTLTVTLDKAPTVNPGDTLTIMTPLGTAQKRTVSEVAGDTVKVSEAFDAVSVAQAMWMVESADLTAQLFTVTDVEEQDDNGQITYAMTCVQHEPGKYAYVDDNVKIQPRPVTVVPPKQQASPATVTITSHQVVDQGISRTTMTIGWDQTANAITYGVEWRKDGGNWVTAGSAIAGLSVDVQGVYTGTYEARVWATNSLGTSSLPTLSGAVVLAGKTGEPPTVATLAATTDQVFAITVSWGFPADGTANDTSYTEIAYSKTNSIDDATTQGIYAYPTSHAVLMGLAAGQSFFFWARLVDRSGNIGAWYPDGVGVNGQSTLNASPVLDLIAGQVGTDSLDQALLDQIGAIPDIESNVSDIQQSLSDLGDLSGLADDIAALKDADLPGLKQTVDELRDEIFPQLAGDDRWLAGDDSFVAGVSEQSLREDADLALAQNIDGLAASFLASTVGIKSTILKEQIARADADGAMAQSIEALQVNYADNAAAIETEQQARTDADSALAQDLETLSATVNNDIAAAITNEQQVRADGDEANATSIEELRASTAADLSAAITDEQNARADADSANAADISTLQVQAGDTSAAVQVVQNAYADLSGKVNASYTVRVQTIGSNGQLVAAGFTLGADGSGSSEFTVSANTFAIVNDNNGTLSSPFAIVNGQVFMANGFIQNAAIGSAQIADTIESSVVGANGRKTWIIDKNGSITSNGVNSGAGYTVQQGGDTSVYDSNGTLLVELGIFS